MPIIIMAGNDTQYLFDATLRRFAAADYEVASFADSPPSGPQGIDDGPRRYYNSDNGTFSDLVVAPDRFNRIAERLAFAAGVDAPTVYIASGYRETLISAQPYNRGNVIFFGEAFQLKQNGQELETKDLPDELVAAFVANMIAHIALGHMQSSPTSTFELHENVYSADALGAKLLCDVGLSANSAVEAFIAFGSRPRSTESHPDDFSRMEALKIISCS